MDILAFIGSAMLFVTFALTVLFILIRISSRLAMLVLVAVPLLAVIIMPGISVVFLSYEHFLFAKGLVPVNNFHILLTIWSTLIGIILYTEFLTWYLSKGKRRTAEEHTSGTSADAGKNDNYVISKLRGSFLRHGPSGK
jgi:predicted membrane protein